LADVVGLSAFDHRHGLDAGDKFLREFTERLSKALAAPPPPCLAGVGGDEFAVLVSDVVLHCTLSQLAAQDQGHQFGPPQRPHQSDQQRSLVPGAGPIGLGGPTGGEGAVGWS
jgi:GGDEF domain-containing protein